MFQICHSVHFIVMKYMKPSDSNKETTVIFHMSHVCMVVDVNVSVNDDPPHPTPNFLPSKNGIRMFFVGGACGIW